ncbi:hypothetical protein [Plantactinospora sp. CA-290183]|uniref:hypothetical protein n=1 Tax=Plantactinospora sp. CA-290183 TaxID=3240006 RepID=UPI003D8E94F3
MESSGPEPRRRPLRLALIGGVAVVVLAAVAGAVVLARGDDSPTEEAPCAALPSTPPPGVDAPGGQAPGGGGLRVVESGFTPVAGNGDDKPYVSLGAVLENTSTRVAHRTLVSFRPVDGRDAPVATPGNLLTQQIPVILPGQRVVVGGATYLLEDAAGRPATVARFHLDLGSTRWVTRDDGDLMFAELTARHQRTERFAEATDTGTVHYTVDSGYCRQISSHGVGVVFRNSAGVIVGGSFQTGGSVRCRPGTSEESVDPMMGIPPEIDDSRTEAYPYCDPVPGGAVDPTASGAPVNYGR